MFLDSIFFSFPSIIGECILSIRFNIKYLFSIGIGQVSASAIRVQITYPNTRVPIFIQISGTRNKLDCQGRSARSDGLGFKVRFIFTGCPDATCIWIIINSRSDRCTGFSRDLCFLTVNDYFPVINLITVIGNGVDLSRCVSCHCGNRFTIIVIFYMPISSGTSCDCCCILFIISLECQHILIIVTTYSAILATWEIHSPITIPAFESIAFNFRC